MNNKFCYLGVCLILYSNFLLRPAIAPSRKEPLLWIMLERKRDYPLAFNLIHNFDGVSHFAKSGEYYLKDSKHVTYFHDDGYIIEYIQNRSSCATPSCITACFDQTDGECYEGFKVGGSKPLTVFMNCLPGGPQTCKDAEYVPFDELDVVPTQEFKIIPETPKKEVEQQERRTSNNAQNLAPMIFIIVAFILVILSLTCTLLYLLVPNEVWENAIQMAIQMWTRCFRRLSKQKTNVLSDEEDPLNANGPPKSKINDPENAQDIKDAEIPHYKMQVEMIRRLMINNGQE